MDKSEIQKQAERHIENFLTAPSENARYLAWEELSTHLNASKENQQFYADTINEIKRDCEKFNETPWYNMYGEIFGRTNELDKYLKEVWDYTFPEKNSESEKCFKEYWAPHFLYQASYMYLWPDWLSTKGLEYTLKLIAFCKDHPEIVETRLNLSIEDLQTGFKRGLDKRTTTGGRLIKILGKMLNSKEQLSPSTHER